MDAKRLAEWLGTADGLIKVITATVASVGALAAPIAGVLPLFNLPRVTGVIATAAILLLVLGYLWREYRRFARESRLEQPDNYTLVATTPENLIGRASDLNSLLLAVTQNRVVLLDGESGCGKSALVGAGLLPRLKAGNGLLPVLVRDWGDDWVRGPLAATLGELYEALASEQREKIEWVSAPDVAAEASAVEAALAEKLDAIYRTLQRRPLLIADQFDDYQAQHRHHFLDENGNWLAPENLVAKNPFWRLVCEHLQAGSLHLLAVTRADTAAGLSCIRFLDNSQIANRTLPKVEFRYLRPLLAGIAPADAVPPVISNPANGWNALRERLETEFRARGAMLMQQVRTVLLGLSELPVLTPRSYRRAGEMAGVEMLAIERALEAASEELGGGDNGVRVAREMLSELVLPAGTDQPPKAQRRSLSALGEMAGSREGAERALRALQRREVVRPVGGDASDGFWQLDHDYLARSVLAEARQADRWGTTLREGLARFNAAHGSWRRRWAGLLPITIQARLVWGPARSPPLSGGRHLRPPQRAQASAAARADRSDRLGRLRI